MQVLLTEENKVFKDSVYNFVISNFKREDLNLKSLWQGLYKKSLISEKNSLLQNILLTEAVCKFCPGIGLFLLTQFACIETIESYANDSLKEKYLPKLFSGETIACFSITEANAGSDVTMIETAGKEKNNNWIINGKKIYTLKDIRLKKIIHK